MRSTIPARLMKRRGFRRLCAGVTKKCLNVYRRNDHEVKATPPDIVKSSPDIEIRNGAVDLPHCYPANSILSN